MADGKWIADLSAHTPLADAARWVLAVRLEVLREHLRLALREPEKDVEHVHQLRVGARRAGAALAIFEECLPKDEFKTARKYLRKLRRAAGAARDWDVFLLALEDVRLKRAPQQEPGFDFLSGCAVAQRVAAQAALREAGADFPFDFERFLAATLDAIRAPHGDRRRTLLDLARPMLTRLIRELDDSAKSDLDDYEDLHQVRIAGKRLRYAMEVFASCFAAPFKERLYPAVEAMQDILGQANDSHVADLRLQALRAQIKAFQASQWPRYRPALDGLLRYHRRRLPKRRQEFIVWWREWEEARVEQAFADLLHEEAALPAAEAQALAALANYGVTEILDDGNTAGSEASAGGMGRGAPSPGADMGDMGDMGDPDGPAGGASSEPGGGAGGGRPRGAGPEIGPGGPTTGAANGPGGAAIPGNGVPTGLGAQTPP